MRRFFTTLSFYNMSHRTRVYLDIDLKSDLLDFSNPSEITSGYYTSIFRCRHFASYILEYFGRIKYLIMYKYILLYILNNLGRIRSSTD